MRFFTAQRKFFSSTAVAALLLLSSCTQLKRPEPEPYFAETAAPPVQELRWSNGKTPKSLDPAKAAAAPETDIVRAIYEGLTDLDPKTLEAVPGVAEKWEPSEDKRTWRFHLRENAVWSTGEPVTAQDFVRSWKRLDEMGSEAAHKELLLNFKRNAVRSQPEASANTNANTSPVPTMTPTASPIPSPTSKTELAIVAESERVLRVDLVHPDKDFSKLIAHPIFRPVFPESKDKEKIVTNGAFRLSSLTNEGVLLERSDKYWDRKAVELERVRIVAANTPEKALELYRAGEIDVVTNAEFSSAAVKLLEPFEDFRRTPHNAINLYEFNTSKEPFNDRRVRQALAIAIEREKVTEGELQGNTRPATGFLPQGEHPESRLAFDAQKAKALLDEAGYPNGEGFPTIRLVINRNDAQQRVARSVAQMWKQNLNIETEIIVKEAAELEAMRVSGDFDAIRRGVVLPTANETASFLSIFEQPLIAEQQPENAVPRYRTDNSNTGPSASSPEIAVEPPVPAAILTEEEALYQVRAVPLYFPTSYSLVKPYVKGFDANALDAPSLKSVRIDQNWRTR